MDRRYQLGIKLRNMIGWDQAEYFPDEARKLVRDWMLLDTLIESNQEELPFFDYSFAMAPMYKAVETVLWKIAEELQLVKEGEFLGSFFNEDNLEKIFPQISEIIPDKKIQAQVKGELSELKNFLLRYRHLPAHVRFKFNNLDAEKIAAHSAIHNLGCIVGDLIKAGLIKVEEKKIEYPEDDEIKAEDIPF